MNDTSITPRPSSLAARAMWLIALVLAIGALSLAVASLPGRARPLFLLPFAFGIGAAAISTALRRSLALHDSVAAWLITTAFALGGYGQVVASSYQQFQAGNSGGTASDPQAAVAIQMLKDTEHHDLAEKMQADLDAHRQTWDRFLERRYTALGNISPRMSGMALVAEAVLVIAGVGLGRRLLDARRSACQA